MKVRAVFAAFLFLAYLLTGCAGGGSDATDSDAKADAPAALNDGPPAASEPTDAALAAQGEVLFQDKGCTACHTFGQKLSGPDLQGVAARRSRAWLETQILHPEEMAKKDPIARDLIATHALQMPNQGLNPDEARAVIEFLKSKETATASSE